MRKVLFFILILFVTNIFSQTPFMDRNRVGTLTIGGNDLDSIRIEPPIAYTPLDGKPWKGAWSINIYHNLVSGTVGTYTIYTRDGDWGVVQVSKNDSTLLEATVTWENNDMRIYDIHNDKPVWSKWIYIQRAGATGTARFHIYQSWVEYKRN